MYRDNRRYNASIETIWIVCRVQTAKRKMDKNRKIETARENTWPTD